MNRDYRTLVGGLTMIDRSTETAQSATSVDTKAVRFEAGSQEAKGKSVGRVCLLGIDPLTPEDVSFFTGHYSRRESNDKQQLIPHPPV